MGSALFLFDINDLPEGIKSKVRLFADDVIIYRNASQPAILQRDLDELEKWEKLWDSLPQHEQFTCLMF